MRLSLDNLPQAEQPRLEGQSEGSDFLPSPQPGGWLSGPGCQPTVPTALPSQCGEPCVLCENLTPDRADGLSCGSARCPDHPDSGFHLDLCKGPPDTPQAKRPLP